ncbi:deoxyribodipyrimidine photo-lyase [Aliidiomarina celeris]|uniref:deoxyribodipyrimidine photo-lyase n=1 Tax=Aliidiomarina celeris TaxID=2249428 RepID=UPI000DEB7D21|nr:deoxyribodipyrimidine photo-lyase [Aliidiomarina celeris]
MSALIWYRQDLRVQDNLAVAHAWQNHECVHAVVAITEVQWQRHDWAPIKRDLYERRLNALAAELGALGVILHTVVCDTDKQLPAALLALAQELHVDALYFNREYPLNEKRRDNAVAAWFEQHGKAVHKFDDLVVVAPERIQTGSGSYYKKFTPFYKTWLKVVAEQGVSAPENLKPKGEPLEPTPITLSGDKRDSSAYGADTSDLQQRMQRFIHERVHHYSSARDLPAKPGTSLLSPYLENGGLGVRTLLRGLAEQAPDFPFGLGKGADTWLSELAWRDFYQHLMWHVPRLSYGKAFITETEQFPWQQNDAHFQAWASGKTGFPIVDAGMRQLAAEGWMHNRVRMIVASFFVKDLQLDWRLGERFFMQNLVDGSFAANNGGWQWSASTGTDAVPYFRVFNPERQSAKFDPSGEYIRRWVKELQQVPVKEIHAPHRWLRQYDRSNNYPAPIVDHSEMREQFIETFKKVKNGSI